MKLRRIEIAQFRKLIGPMVLDGLGDGLAIVSGDNEEGKSTVLAALKAAFFEHHGIGGAVREAMAPHGGGVPEIVVEFECRGQSYRLRKAFRRAGVSLESGGQRLQDDAAERRLQEVLQFERRQARTARPENAGVQALFWVDQATAFRDFDCITGGHERLTAAIAAEVGTVAGGEGARRLLALVRERAAAFYTAGRQQETGALKVASEQLKVLEAEHLTLDGRRRDFEARVDRLARLRDERRRLIEQDQAGRARERCEVGRKRLTELADLERRCALAAEALKSAGAELARVEAQHRMRVDLMAEADRLDTGARELGGRLDAMEQELGILRQAMESGTRAEMEASAAAAAAERAASTLRDRLARARLTQEIERLGEAAASCRVAQDQLQRAQAAWSSIAATPERLKMARERHQVSQTAAARVATAATRLDFQPAGGRTASVAGAEVDAREPLRIMRPTVVELEGYGRLVVTPGGEDLEVREAALAAAQEAFVAALAAMGVASLAEAEAALERRRAAESELQSCQAEIKAVLQATAVPSLEALAQRLADRDAERTVVDARLDRSAETPDAAALERLVEESSSVLDRARQDLEAVRQGSIDSQRRLAAAEAAVAGIRGEQSAAATRAEELATRLAVERDGQSDKTLAAALATARAGSLAAEQAHGRLTRELQGSDVEGLRERLAIAERELSDLETEHRRLDGVVRDLEIALREAGGDSWLERLGEIDGLLAAARENHRRLQLEGQAWRLLTEKLAAADQSVRESLVAPVSLRLQPLLQRVFPNSEPVLDPERLSLTHLRRDSATEAFEVLSVGAREQLAVLVRLAFATLLAERDGDAPCLILDDALVYADEARFETMKAILQRAAREMQIIVLTCRPRDYFGLDARYLRLEDCRAT